MRIQSSCRLRKPRLVTACFLLLILLSAAAPVCADSGTKGIQTMVKTMITDICELGTSNGVIDILITNPKDRYPEVWGMTETLVRNVITPISYSLLGLYFIVSLVSTGMKYEGLTVEMLAKPFIRMVAAVIAVRQVPILLVAGMSAGSQFVSMVRGSVVPLSQAETVVDTAFHYAKETITGYFSGFTIMMQLFLPWIAARILDLLIRLIAYSLTIEIFVTAIFMPLTFGEIVTHGVDGGGFRYLKRFIALCMQAGVMVIVAGISAQFAIGWWEVPSFQGFLVGVAKMLIAEGACAFLMIKSGSICRSVLGL